MKVRNIETPKSEVEKLEVNQLNKFIFNEFNIQDISFEENADNVNELIDSMNLKNINQSISDSIRDFKNIIKESKNEGIRTKCYISVAFHCPYEGKVDPGYVSALIDEILDYGVDEIVIADTIGAANPYEVKELLKRQLRTNDTGKFSMHFHDTKALALSNIYASLEEGISKFDSCIGGLGGCPFAPGATGNLATEDLVGMLYMMNLDTGIDIDLLHQSRELASNLTGLQLGGRMPYSGANI